MTLRKGLNFSGPQFPQPAVREPCQLTVTPAALTHTQDRQFRNLVRPSPTGLPAPWCRDAQSHPKTETKTSLSPMKSKAIKHVVLPVSGISFVWFGVYFLVNEPATFMTSLFQLNGKKGGKKRGKVAIFSLYCQSADSCRSGQGRAAPGQGPPASAGTCSISDLG